MMVTVAEIVKDGSDTSGAKILTVYTKILGRYAIYRTEERVLIQFADDPKRGDAQRMAVAPLNPLRGQINGLIDGWRMSGNDSEEARASLFDSRIADALGIALQGTNCAVEHAMALLAAIKDDVVAERTSRARVIYGVSAATTAAALICLACLFTWSAYQSIYEFSADGRLLWLAVGAGALGALFSVAIGLQSRQILTDLQRRENVSDAVLRVMIGSISGLVLAGLIQSQLFTVNLGGGLNPATGPRSWLIAAFIAFLAGFSERLVPSLLEEKARAAQGGREGAGTNPLTGTQRDRVPA